VTGRSGPVVEQSSKHMESDTSAPTTYAAPVEALPENDATWSKSNSCSATPFIQTTERYLGSEQEIAVCRE